MDKKVYVCQYSQHLINLSQDLLTLKGALFTVKVVHGLFLVLLKCLNKAPLGQVTLTAKTSVNNDLTVWFLLKSSTKINDSKNSNQHYKDTLQSKNSMIK